MEVVEEVEHVWCNGSLFFFMVVHDSLEHKRLSPKEHVTHLLAAALGVQNTIEVHFTEVALLGHKVACFHDPH